MTADKKVLFISETDNSTMSFVSTAYKPQARIVYNKLLKTTKKLPDTVIQLADFIDVKGMKSQGNQMTKLKVKEVVLNVPEEGEEQWPEIIIPEKTIVESVDDEPSETMEWDVSKGDDENSDQAKLF